MTVYTLLLYLFEIQVYVWNDSRKMKRWNFFETGSNMCLLIDIEMVSIVKFNNTINNNIANNRC